MRPVELPEPAAPASPAAAAPGRAETRPGAALWRHADRLLRAVVGAGILVCAGVLFVNVVLRYVFNAGLVWAEELVRYLIVWVVFLGSAVVAREGSHIAVDALLLVIPAGARRLMGSLSMAGAALFSALLAGWSWQLTTQIRLTGQITPGLGMPTYIAYLSIPVGSALMVPAFLYDAWRRWQATGPAPVPGSGAPPASGGRPAGGDPAGDGGRP